MFFPPSFVLLRYISKESVDEVFGKCCVLYFFDYPVT